MLKETLIQIGFTRNEAKIYLALVELGPQPANIIARKVVLNRTTIYPVLKNLQKKSLISSFIKNGIQFFAVNDINNLLEYVDRKRRFVEHQRGFVVDILPKMEQLKSSLVSEPKVHYFEGVNGVETVMSDWVKDLSAGRIGFKDPILSITSPEKWLQSDMLPFIKGQIKLRVVGKKVPIRTLSKDTAEARCFFDEYASICGGDLDRLALSEVRYVRDGEDIFDNIVRIYGNKVAMVAPDRGFEFGILIESEEFARTQRSLFELAWKGAQVVNEDYDKKNG
ncbi:hypothetical protein HOE67_00965, partial [Candidatus Peregrinibacteria bacterium]|nr:hypothetical protein [Candidatus Peregrinibacteria bacterium]